MKEVNDFIFDEPQRDYDVVDLTLLPKQASNIAY